MRLHEPGLSSSFFSGSAWRHGSVAASRRMPLGSAVWRSPGGAGVPRGTVRARTPEVSRPRRWRKPGAATPPEVVAARFALASPYFGGAGRGQRGRAGGSRTGPAAAAPARRRPRGPWVGSSAASRSSSKCGGCAASCSHSVGFSPAAHAHMRWTVLAVDLAIAKRLCSPPTRRLEGRT